MAAKPTIADSRWATDAGAELTAPSSGQRDSGFESGTTIVTDYSNVLHKEAYKWAQYLDEGVLTGALSFASAISPAAIGVGSTNNYAPTGFATCQRIRQDLSANALISGLAGGSDGRVIFLANIDAAFRLTLTDEDTNSTDINRFTLGGSSLILEPGGAAILVYDGTSTRWRVFASHKCSKELTFWIPGQAATFDAGNEWTKTGGYITPNGAHNATWGLQLATGDRITAIGASIQNDNVNTLTLSLRRITAAGSAGARGTPVDSTMGGGSNPEALVVNDMSSEDVGDDGYYHIAVDASAADADLRVYGVSCTVTRRIA